MNNIQKLESAVNILSSLELDKEEGMIVADEKELGNSIAKLQSIKHKLTYKNYSPEDFIELAKSKDIFLVNFDGMEHECLKECSLNFLQACFNNAVKKSCFFIADLNHLRLHVASEDDLEGGIYQAFVIKVD